MMIKVLYVCAAFQLLCTPVLSNPIVEASFGFIPEFSSDHFVPRSNNNYNNLFIWGIAGKHRIWQQLPLYFGISDRYGQKLLDQFNNNDPLAPLEIKETIYLNLLEFVVSYEINLPYKFVIFPEIGIGYIYCLIQSTWKIYGYLYQNGQYATVLTGDPKVSYSKGFLLLVPRIKIQRHIFKKIGISSQFEMIRFKKELNNYKLEYTTAEPNVWINRKSSKIEFKTFNVGLNLFYEF